jgi:hypothetical protein
VFFIVFWCVFFGGFSIIKVKQFKNLGHYFDDLRR